MKRYSSIVRIKRIAKVRLNSAMADLGAVTSGKQHAERSIGQIAGAAAGALGGEGAGLADLAIFGQSRMRWTERARELTEKVDQASARAVKAKAVSDKACEAAAEERRMREFSRNRREELGAQEYLSWRK
ncbi:MAG: hypothetical protein ACREP6_04435 [Candidatus Binataceae bacterium]